jgi:hypothetical protein
MSSPGRVIGALITTALAIGALAGPAAAKVTFSGIADVRLNMSETAVRDALGTPTSTAPARNPDAVSLTYRRHKIEVVVHRARDRVVGIVTTSRAQRTSSGLGVGSSTRSVRAKLRGETCGAVRRARTLLCSVERRGRVLEFTIRRGKVVRVAVVAAAG